MDWLRFFIAAIFIAAGLIAALIAAFGMFRFHFVLNRMHSAAICDTCSILFILTGLAVISGFNFTTLKFILVILFLWLASPVSSHLISNLIVVTDGHIKEECLMNEETEQLEKQEKEG